MVNKFTKIFNRSNEILFPLNLDINPKLNFSTTFFLQPRILHFFKKIYLIPNLNFVYSYKMTNRPC